MRRVICLTVVAALTACQQPQTIENDAAPNMSVDPAQPPAVTPATSGAEGETISEEQRKAAAASNQTAPH